MLMMASMNYVLLRRAISRTYCPIPENVDTIILGDSHTETALDPDVIPNSINISLSSEHYFYTYYKIRYLLNACHNIEHVIVGFSYHNLGKRDDIYLFADSPGSRVDIMYERYFLIVGHNGIKKLMSFSKVYWAKLLKYKFGMSFQWDPVFLAKALLEELTYTDYAFIGRFYKSKKSHVNSEIISKTIQKHYYVADSKPQNFSETAISYFKRIVKLCTTRGIQLVIINTPLHPDYKNQIPENFLLKYTQVLSQLLKTFPEVQYLDYSELKMPISYYGDADHVNYYGAEIVSAKIRRQLLMQEK